MASQLTSTDVSTAILNIIPAVMGIYYWPSCPNELLWSCFLLIVLKVFCIHAGGHRYFAHRSFECSPWLKHLMAFGIMSSNPVTVFYWMYEHNDHHKDCELKEDFHSPYHLGFWHVQFSSTPIDKDKFVKKIEESGFRHKTCYGVDFSWVTLKNSVLIFVGQMIACLLIGPYLGYGAIEMLVWGSFIPNLISGHLSRLTNSAGHWFGPAPYKLQSPYEACRPTNCWWTALLNGGEGWHNNHHAYALAARHGFTWWQIDFTWYFLVLLALGGQVWNIKVVNDKIVEHITTNPGGAAPKASYRTTFSRKTL